MSRLRARLADQRGMTLIELMVAISLLGIVIGPISASFLLGFLESTATRDRIADSTSVQVTSAYLLSDIQSSKVIVVDGTTSCRPGGLVDGEAVLEIQWTDPELSLIHI